MNAPQPFTPRPNGPCTGWTLERLAASDPAYGDLVADHVWGSLFSSPPWLRALEQGYGFKVEILAATERGRPVAAMPYVRLTDLRGDRLAVLPFSDYADPLVEDPGILATLIDELIDDGLPVRFRVLHNRLPLADRRLAEKDQAFWHAVDLGRPVDDIWAGLEGSARQNCRKAERQGVKVRIGHSLADVQLFHRMHCHLRKTKYQMLAQPTAFFQALHDAFAPKGHLAVAIAEANGEPLAGVLLLEWQDTLYYKFNASLDTRFRPNDLLTWQSIRYAIGRGLRRFDFGLSDADQPGLIRYKRKFASIEGKIQTLGRSASPVPERHHQDAGAMLGRLTELLTRTDVPEDVTRQAGDTLYRYFA